MSITMQIPTLYKAAFPAKGNLAIEHAPLRARANGAALAELFVMATSFSHSGQTFVVMADKVNQLKAQMEKWSRSSGVKWQRRPNGFYFIDTDVMMFVLSHHHEIDYNDPPFLKIHRLLICDAHKLFAEIKESLERYLVGPTVAVGSFADADHWFYDFAREKDTVLHRVTAKKVLKEYPDQDDLYDKLRTTYSKTEIARYLNLKDVVAERRIPPMKDWLREYLSHHFPLEFSALHIDICERMEWMAKDRGQTEGKIAPRGSAKTTCASLGYPVYAICHHLEDYIVLAADSTGQAVQRVEAIQHELENNPKIALDYPEASGEGPVWNKNHLVTNNGIHVQAVGIGKKSRGSKQKQFRPTVVIADDLDDDDIPFSPRKREKNWHWVTSNLLNMGVTGHTNYFFLGTSLHPDCVVCRLPKSGIKVDTFPSIKKWPDRMDLWQHWEDILVDLSIHDVDERKDMAEDFYEKNYDAMNFGAEVLWPEYEPIEALMELRSRIGPRAFENEKQGNPVDPSSCEWDRKYFEGDIFFDRWPKICDVKIMSLDPSKGRTDKPGDFQAITQLAISKGRIFVDADISRRPIVEMLEQFIDMMVEFRPDVAVIEDAAFQELLLYMADDIALRRRLVAAIEPIGHESVRKEVRIRRLGPFIVRKQIKYRRPSPGVNLMLEQLAGFPNNATHDDGPDSFEMALRKARLMLGARQRQPVANPF